MRKFHALLSSGLVLVCILVLLESARGGKGWDARTVLVFTARGLGGPDQALLSLS